MWKVVTSELTYLNTRFNVLWYFPTAYLILLCILLCYDRHTRATDQIHLTLIELFITTIIMTFLLKLIELTLYEINEKRVRQQALLPLPRWQMGVARFLTPTIPLVILYVALTGYLYIVLASRFILSIDKYILLFPMTLILPVYSIRLFSEKSGKALFIIPVLFKLIISGFLFIPFSISIFLLMLSFDEFASTTSGAILISAFISIFLWISFITRKSYLR